MWRSLRLSDGADSGRKLDGGCIFDDFQIFIKQERPATRVRSCLVVPISMMEQTRRRRGSIDLGAAMAASCSIVYGRAVQSVQISLHYSDFRMECKQSFPVLGENLSDSRETAKTGRIFQRLSEFVGVLKIHSAGQKIFCMLTGRTASVRPACFSD